jgi:hypothetical protein
MTFTPAEWESSVDGTTWIENDDNNFVLGRYYRVRFTATPTNPASPAPAQYAWGALAADAIPNLGPGVVTHLAVANGSTAGLEITITWPATPNLYLTVANALVGVTENAIIIPVDGSALTATVSGATNVSIALEWAEFDGTDWVVGVDNFNDPGNASNTFRYGVTITITPSGDNVWGVIPADGFDVAGATGLRFTASGGIGTHAYGITIFHGVPALGTQNPLAVTLVMDGAIS